MNIKLAYNFDLWAYKSLFPEIELFNWNNDLATNIDLLVFPGGEDVNPEYYLSGVEYRTYVEMCYFNIDRDRVEADILDGAYDGRIKVNKILGICRGMQFLNVMFDGSLYPDLYTIGHAHTRLHNIKHQIPNNLDFLTIVNSLHHQAVNRYGTYNRRGNKVRPQLISTDEKGIVPEIMTWDNDKVLGVQFHPEYFDDSFEEKKLFREFCYDWVNGKKTILKSGKESKND